MTLSGARRATAVAVLLAVAAIGLRSRGVFSHAGNATATAFSGSALAITLAVTEGFALVAFVIVLVSARRKRAPPEEEKEYEDILPRWLKFPLLMVALTVLAVPLYLVYAHRHKNWIPAQSSRHASIHPGTQQHVSASTTGLVSILVGVGLAVGALLAIAVYARVRSRGNRDEADPARRGLAQRLAAAIDALHETDDPRRAIIACYAELERGFAAAGSAPRGADTPAEVLARAASAGLVRSRSAADLTGLFRRARYSTEPMTPGDAATAEHSLDAMRAELDGPP